MSWNPCGWCSTPQDCDAACHRARRRLSERADVQQLGGFLALVAMIALAAGGIWFFAQRRFM